MSLWQHLHIAINEKLQILFTNHIQIVKYTSRIHRKSRDCAQSEDHKR